MEYAIAECLALASLCAVGSLRVSAFLDDAVDRVYFDSRHGVDTGRLGGRGARYMPSPARTIRGMIAALPIARQDYVFVDIGSGKGRGLLVAAEFPFQRCIGVERDAALNDIALANVGAYRNRARKCPRIEPRCLDAAGFEFPDAPTVVYLFNPFARPVMERVAANLARSLERSPRPVYVIYYHPRWCEVFSRLPAFRPVSLPGAPIDYFAVFASASAA